MAKGWPASCYGFMAVLHNARRIGLICGKCTGKLCFTFKSFYFSFLSVLSCCCFALPFRLGLMFLTGWGTLIVRYDSTRFRPGSHFKANDCCKVVPWAAFFTVVQQQSGCVFCLRWFRLYQKRDAIQHKSKIGRYFMNYTLWNSCKLHSVFCIPRPKTHITPKTPKSYAICAAKLPFLTFSSLHLPSISLTHRRILTCQLLAVAVVRTPRVVAALRDAPVLAGEHEPVRAVVQLRLVVDALPVPIAVRHVTDHLRLGFARVLLVLALSTGEPCFKDGYSALVR